MRASIDVPLRLSVKVEVMKDEKSRGFWYHVGQQLYKIYRNRKLTGFPLEGFNCTTPGVLGSSGPSSHRSYGCTQMFCFLNGTSFACTAGGEKDYYSTSSLFFWCILSVLACDIE